VSPLPWESFKRSCPEGVLIGAVSDIEPPDPSEGCFVIWMTATTDGYGDAGNVLIKATYGGLTRTATIMDFSAAGGI